MTRRKFLGEAVAGGLALGGVDALDRPLAGQVAGGSARAIRIWDVHCHLAQGSAGPEDRIAESLRFADRMGIERLIFCMGYPHTADPSPQQLREQNDQLLQAVRRHPDRAFGFVYLNPNHVEFSLQEFDRCVRDGPMVGIKLWIARRANARELDPIVERAISMQAPILQHAWIKTDGNEPGESTPADVAELANRHPQASIICAHSGGNWELGLRMMRAARNVFPEVAGSDPTAGFVEMGVREVGPERLIYGSDIEGRSFASQLSKVLGADISETAKGLILGSNLRRILTPILKRKGYRV